MKKRVTPRLGGLLIMMVLVTFISAGSRAGTLQTEYVRDGATASPDSSGEGAVKSVVFSLDQGDQYFDLACKHQGWTGYFAPARWQTRSSYADDDFVGSSAPRATVVDDLTRLLLNVSTGRSTEFTWYTTIPADGYLVFSVTGDGDLAPNCRILINDQEQDAVLQDDGTYFSPYLRAGDIFSLIFFGKNQVFQWSNFTFYSNSVGVLVSAEQEIVPGPERLIRQSITPVPRADLTQILFASAAPEEWPVIDLDGSTYTLDDQRQLRASTFEFQLQYYDDVALRDGQPWLRRHFTVVEICSGNGLELDRWWVPLPLVIEDDRRAAANH